MLIKDIERVLALAESRGWRADGDSISRVALIHLLRRLEQIPEACSILQLGGDRTAHIWAALLGSHLLPASVNMIEHHPGRAARLIGTAESVAGLTGHRQSLKQVTDDEREEMFAHPEGAVSLWAQAAKPVPPERYEHYTIRNAFYGEVPRMALPPDSVDALIVDGPHGNGRSIAFPLFCAVLKRDALVLIDDFDHYPFVSDLARIYAYEEIHRDTWEERHWLLLRLNGLRR